MKKYKVSKEFILEAHNSACSKWKQKLEKEFPEVFEIKIEVGKWYATIGGSLFYLSSLDGDKNKGYGFTPDGDWRDNRETDYFFGYKSDVLREAKDEEVEESLIAEAKRRGFEVGNFRCLLDGCVWGCDAGQGWALVNGSLFLDASVCYEDGKWAEIIDDKSELKEEIKSLEDKLKELRSKL